MIFATMSHALYYVTSQQARGEQHATALVGRPTGASRPLSRIMKERAKLEAEVAVLAATTCLRDCIGVRIRMAALRSGTAALEQEGNEVRELQAADRQLQIARDRARQDPAAAAIGQWVKLPAETLSLVMGLLAGILLDGIGCVGWLIVLSSRVTGIIAPRYGSTPTLSNSADRELDVDGQVSRAIGAGLVARSTIEPARIDVDPRFADLLATARIAVNSGEVPVTVRSLRSYLQCGQDTAAVICRALRAVS
jgi:hypothetical protein